jgi:hypothetical protein
MDFLLSSLDFLIWKINRMDNSRSKGVVLGVSEGGQFLNSCGSM